MIWNLIFLVRFILCRFLKIYLIFYKNNQFKIIIFMAQLKFKDFLINFNLQIKYY